MEAAVAKFRRGGRFFKKLDAIEIQLRTGFPCTGNVQESDYAEVVLIALEEIPLNDGNKRQFALT
jgi:hypothetical protein